MSTQCHPQARARLYRVADVLDSMQGVMGHTLQSPTLGDHEQWTLRVTLRGGGVPSAVLTLLGHYGCQLHTSDATDDDTDRWQFVATV